MVTWSLPYRLVPLLQSINLDELAEATQLQPTRSDGGPLATEEADRMLVADHTLRADNQTMAHRSGAFLFGVQKNGAGIAANVQTLLIHELRTHYGNGSVIEGRRSNRPTERLATELMASSKFVPRW